MSPDLLKSISRAEKLFAAKKKVRDLSENDRYADVCECSALRYCCFICHISPIEGLIRTGADYLTKGQKKPDIRHG